MTKEPEWLASSPRAGRSTDENIKIKQGATGPNGQYPYVAYLTGAGVALATIDVASRSIINTMQINGNPDQSVVTPNGHFLYMMSDPYSVGTVRGQTNFDGQLIVVDLVQHKVVATIDEGSGLGCGLAVAPSGDEVLESFCGNEGIRAYRTGTSTLLATIRPPNDQSADQFSGIAFSQNGRTIFAAEPGSGRIDLINARSYQVTGSFQVVSGPSLIHLGPVALSPPGNVLCIATDFFRPYELLVVKLSKADR